MWYTTPTMLTVPQAAARVRRTEETIRRWIRSGRLPARKIGTQHVIDAADLRRAVHGGAARAGEEAIRYEIPAVETSHRREDLLGRIVVSADVAFGKPRVRGSRITVSFVLGLLAAGWSEAEIVRNYPSLSGDDLRACLAYAALELEDEQVFPAE